MSVTNVIEFQVHNEQCIATHPTTVHSLSSATLTSKHRNEHLASAKASALGAPMVQTRVASDLHPGTPITQITTYCLLAADIGRVVD